MCGIAGFFDSRHSISDAGLRLKVFQQSLQHRGPDDCGAWSSPGGVAHFAHTRLSILDLSLAGHQPMSLPGGRFTITFNGEIYNFRALRDDLEHQGAVFQTGTDTEVILHLYQKHGSSMLPMLRGMFAFAIWDEAEQKGFLARDPLGIKPIYYTQCGSVFAFASELSALQKAAFTGKDVDADALTTYFETGSVSEPYTLIRGVRSLEAGHFIEWKNGLIEKRSYWHIEFPANGSAKDSPKVLRQALLDSVRNHFVSDVPVGIFLSGGIDSTALVALAREIGIRDISTFSIGVDDPSLDESSLARRTASHFKTDHHELVLNESEGMRRFEQYIQHIDQPSIDGFNTFTVSAFAREKGMKVVLSGLGSDELFAGYPSFTQVPRLISLSSLLNLLPGVRQHIGMRMEHHSQSHRMRRLGAFLQSENNVRNAYRAFRGIFSRRAGRILAARYSGATLSEFMVRTSIDEAPQIATPTLRDGVSLCELSIYMRNQLLKDSDVMSMANSLELRVPFVDRDLFETVARIPAASRLQQGKKLLLAAVPEIPEWVVNQPKRGFLFPYQKWATSTWGPMFEKAATRLPDSNPTWYQLWCVFMLDRWLAQHGLNFDD